MFSGPKPVRMRRRASSSFQLRRYCTLSMAQCPRLTARTRCGEAWCGVRLVTPSAGIDTGLQQQHRMTKAGLPIGPDPACGQRQHP